MAIADGQNSPSHGQSEPTHAARDHQPAFTKSTVAAQPMTAAVPSTTADATQVDHFLVCGLGSLGQYCIYNLQRFAQREFAVHITAIDKKFPEDWEVHNLLDLLASPPILGDCCNEEVLLKAGVQSCRAILLVTSNENVNIEAAIAARRLNPKIRLVVRSSKHNLNQLLKQHLGDFVAFEATELPAATFALAGLRAGILGSFNLGEHRLQVVQQRVHPRDYRLAGLPAALLHKPDFRLLSHFPAEASLPAIPQPRRAFYQWQPTTIVQPGDTVVYLEVIGSRLAAEETEPTQDGLIQKLLHWLRGLPGEGMGQRLGRFWRWIQANQARRVVLAGLITGVVLWISAAVMFKSTVPGINWKKAIASGAVLLFGGYGDIFGGLDNDPVPGWVYLFSFLITLVSFLFVLGALGLIAEHLLSSRFDFLQKRPPIPQRNHVVLVGLGRLGQRIATLLTSFKQPLVAITEQLENAALVTEIPVIVGNPIQELNRVNLATAKSIIVVTDDQMLNLEVALMAREAARKLGRQLEMVVRTYDQRFSDNLQNLLPDARILAAYGLSGEAFAGAAFGENILSLFQMNDQTILVTEYYVQEGDSLVGKLLAQIAYGYSVVPILHQRSTLPLVGDLSEHLMPADDRVLQVGDRLIVLATINGLRRIERSDIAPPKRWRLTAKPPLNQTFLHYAGNDLARISGCSLNVARAFMNSLPASIELDLYDYQAYHLQEELSRRLLVTLTPLDD